MGIGSAIQSAVTSAITVLGSSITITPYTIASSDSGFSGQAETDGTAVSETAIPFDELKKVVKQDFGDLETGKFQLALKSTATFEITGATKYKATYNSEVYDISLVNRYAIEDTLVAWIITLEKRVD